MSVQDYDHGACHVLFTGTSGNGKSTLHWDLVRKEKARLKFVYDHKASEFSKRYGLSPVYDGPGLVEATAKGGWVCFDPIELFPGRLAAGFNFFCNYVWEVSQVVKGRKILICDELQRMITPTKEPREPLIVWECGRSFQIDTFCISQAPNRLHNTIRNQITRVYAFRQNDSNATEFLTQAGIDDNQVRNLPPYGYVWRDLNSGATGRGGPATAPDRKASPDPVPPGGRAATKTSGGSDRDSKGHTGSAPEQRIQAA